MTTLISVDLLRCATCRDGCDHEAGTPGCGHHCCWGVTGDKLSNSCPGVLVERVLAGATWLDRVAAGWWRDLAPGTVRFSNWLYGRERLWFYVHRQIAVAPYLRPQARVRYGFDLPNAICVDQYNDLSDMWANVVRERHRDTEAYR